MNRQRRRRTSLFAALAIVATGVVLTGSVSPTSADGALGVSVLVSDDHPGMIKVRWTNRPAAVNLGELFGQVRMLRIEWSGDGVAEEAYLVLYPDSPDAIVIPNLVAGTYDVTVSALIAPFTFDGAEVKTETVAGVLPGDPCTKPDPPPPAPPESIVGVDGQPSHLCARIEIDKDLHPALRGETFLGVSSRGTTNDTFGGDPTGTGWLGWDPTTSTITSSGLRRDQTVGPLASLGNWYRMKIQLTDATGSVPSQWWYANFGADDTDNGATYQTATEILVPASLVGKEPVQVEFATLGGATTKYEGVFTKSFGASPEIDGDDFAERLCVEFFTEDGNFAQQVCSIVGGRFVADGPPAVWSIRLPDAAGPYRVRFVDSVNFDPGFIARLKGENELLTYNASFARQWCGLPISDEVQCGSASSFLTARPVTASDNTVSLSAVLGPAGQLRVDVLGVPGGYRDGITPNPQDFVAYVEDTVNGRWFNAYVEKGEVVDGVATWGINAPGLVAGRTYRVFVQTFSVGDLLAQRFFLGADQGQFQTFTAFSSQADPKPVVQAQWPQSVMIPYVVRVVKPDGDVYRAPEVPNDDVCIAVIRRSDQRVMASSCVADNTLDIPSLVTLQPFPLDEGDPNTTYAAVAWKRNAGGAIVGSPYLLQIPNPLEHSEFLQTGYAEGFFDRRALNPGVVLPDFPEPGDEPTANLTVAVP